MMSPSRSSRLLLYLHLLSCRSFQSEVTSPRDVCMWADFPNDICSTANSTKGVVIEPVESAISGAMTNVSREQEHKDGMESESESADTAEAGSTGGDGVEDVEGSGGSGGETLEHSDSTGEGSHVTWAQLDKEDALLAEEVSRVESS